MTRTKQPAGWIEMVGALQLVYQGLHGGAMKSSPVIQFPAKGAKSRAARLVSVQSIVAAALKKAGVKPQAF